MLLRTATQLALLSALASAQTTSRVSINSSGLPANNSGASDLSISDDGRWVAFESAATNLSPVDADLNTDVYVHDRANGSVELASVDSSGIKGNGSSFAVTVSADGNRLAFASGADNLIAGDSNGAYDIFVRDRAAGTTHVVSLSTGGTLGNGFSIWPSISADGNSVAFTSFASNLVVGDVASVWDVFVHDTATNTTELVSQSSAGVPGNADSGFPFITSGYSSGYISGDGRYVVFESHATNLVPGDTNGGPDVFLRDRQTSTTTRINVDPSGGQVASTSCTFVGVCMKPAISRDGRFVAFNSTSPEIVAGDTNGDDDVFVRDLLAGTTERVSVSSLGAQANNISFDPTLSSDGRFVCFSSDATNLVPGDTNIRYDIYVRDRLLGTTARVNVSTLGTESDETSGQPAMSGDGSAVGFFSWGTTLIGGDTTGVGFVFDLFLNDTSIFAPVVSYCTAKLNSIGCVPVISSAGAPRATGNDAFFLIATDVLNQKNGIYFWGLQPAALPFGGGTLCIAPPLVRTAVQSSGGAHSGASCTGTYSFHFRQSYMAANGLTAGDTIRGQFWSRDPGFAPPQNIGLTDAVQFTIAP